MKTTTQNKSARKSTGLKKLVEDAAKARPALKVLGEHVYKKRAAKAKEPAPEPLADSSAGTRTKPRAVVSEGLAELRRKQR